MNIKDLISEGTPRKLSLGRVAFWVLFSIILYKAITIGQIDSSLITMAFGLLAYGFGKKLPIVNGKLNNNNGE